MVETKKNGKIIVEYSSIEEFVKFCLSNTENDTFKVNKCVSKEVDDYRTEFTGTKSLEEALDLMRNGWGEGSEKLSHIFREKVKANEIGKVRRNVLGMQGYQPVVPLYLANQPECMVASVMKPMKQKIVTLDKDISYSCNVRSSDIMNYSANALKIIHSFESSGYRCNLNVVLGTSCGSSCYMVKVKVKSANERFNISKMTFPLAHTSMLRRLYFRWLEVYPGVPRGYAYGYGTPVSVGTLKQVYKDDYILPRVIDDYKVNRIKKVEDLYNKEF